MSYGTNNFWPPPPPRNWQWGQGYGAYGPNNGGWNRGHSMFPGPPFWFGQNGRGGFQEPWLPTEEIIMGGPWGLYSFPDPRLSPTPLRILYEIARNYPNPRPSRLSIPQSPPRFMAPARSMQLPTHEEESRLTQDEQKNALRKLKKEIYNPTPKRIAKRLNQYYRHNAYANARNRRFDGKGKEEDEDDDDDGKKCAICLEDFEPKNPVILTPCNHMFHEECIVPWVKSHGKCPVCRFAICERMRENLVLPPNNNMAHVPASDLFAEEIEWFLT